MVLMFYDGEIDFLTYLPLRAPRPNSLGFDESEHGINIQVRHFQGCYTKGKNGKHMIFRSKDKVGFLYFDMDSAVKVKSQDCAVIGVSEDDDNDDPDKEYYILAVRKTSGKEDYERLGAGRVRAHYGSKRSTSGKLL